jgi:GntR family transcriptional regulator, uxu operon transcriptional repressor
MAISASRPQPQPPAYGRDLAQLILTRCEDPAYAPGGRLPTERSLADEFGVTRTVVRHALAMLQAEGRISREVGRGTFLRSSAGSGLIGADRARAVSGVSPADVMAARRLIEPQVLPLVVAWATPRDFEEMRRCVAGGAGAESYEAFEVWDFALHHAIVAASRNELLLTMYGVVETARKGEIWGSLKRRNDSRERRVAYQADHVELVEALCARELEHAIRVMHSHLSRVQANLLDSAPSRSG